ncbi:transmembrane protein, putative [Medicago truncatula]|uniref:Transmembrane protein, putative n=1 Tax=Medicago truncatula TaxID=3880 RepID=G7JD40_MEDTR|nr:transmembrane protein, putative [Medicago truncatula]
MLVLISTPSIPNYKTLLRIFFVSFYKTSLLFPTTLIISLHTCPYLLYIFFFNQQ